MWCVPSLRQRVDRVGRANLARFQQSDAPQMCSYESKEGPFRLQPCKALMHKESSRIKIISQKPDGVAVVHMRAGSSCCTQIRNSVACGAWSLKRHGPAGVRAAAAAHHGFGGGRAPLPENLDSRQGARPRACHLHSRHCVSRPCEAEVCSLLGVFLFCLSALQVLLTGGLPLLGAGRQS